MGKSTDFIKSLLGICETKHLNPHLWSLEDKQKIRVKLSETAGLFANQKGVYLTGKGLHKPILLIKTDDGRYLAFTNRCTHLGHRKLDPVPGKPVLRCCSMNHSTFDYEGKRLTGPARHPLSRHEVEQSNGDLLIRL